MKQTFLPFAVLAFFLATALPCRAQLFVDSIPYTAQELAMDFFDGNCVDVLNAEFEGKVPQITFFEGSQSGLNLNAGLILTTGAASVAAGPNDADNASGGFGVAAPNPLIQQISNGSGFDLAMLHLTIVPHTDSIGFKYIFGSEEYCEYVNSQFNDAFGFWIKGPGYPSETNIAMIPGSQVPVTINNVNHLTNTGFYINNTPDTGVLCGQLPGNAPTMNYVQYDGLTTVLIAGAHVTPDAVYEVWIGVSDIGDGIYDSGVFLSAESLCGDSLLSPSAGFAASGNDLTVKFHNTTKYATKWHWDFGDGATSDDRFPEHSYATLDQQYKVTLIATNYCCSDTSYAFVGTSGVKSAQTTLECKVYPTAFDNQLVIEPADAAAQGQIRISDLSGRVLLQARLNGKTVLHTGELARGAYLLEIQTTDGKLRTQKIVK